MEAGRFGEGKTKTFPNKESKGELWMPPVGRRRPFEDKINKTVVDREGPSHGSRDCKSLWRNQVTLWTEEATKKGEPIRRL